MNFIYFDLRTIRKQDNFTMYRHWLADTSSHQYWDKWKMNMLKKWFLNFIEPTQKHTYCNNVDQKTVKKGKGVKMYVIKDALNETDYEVMENSVITSILMKIYPPILHDQKIIIIATW